jgi:hypothetical protein
LAGISSYWIYLGLLPLPLVFKASITTLKYYNNMEKLIPALGANIGTVLLTDALLAAAIFITIL